MASVSKIRSTPEDLLEIHGRPMPELVDVKDFLNAGVLSIWIVSTGSRTILVLRPDGTSTRLKPEDVLEGDDVLPGFRLEVAALFE